VKHSTHKTLTAFLKAAEKDGLLTLKHAKGDVLVAGVAAAHPAYDGYRAYRTVQQDDDARRKAARSDEGAPQEMDVAELWKPHGKSLPLCAALSLSYPPPLLLPPTY
jgi:translation initiation factor 2D